MTLTVNEALYKISSTESNNTIKITQKRIPTENNDIICRKTSLKLKIIIQINLIILNIINFNTPDKKQNTSLLPMTTNWMKPNIYIVENGKLVPRPHTPQHKKKNYRYIPYDPLNNPGPEDYFRETIHRLQKENIILRKELNQKLEEETKRNMMHGESVHAIEIQQCHSQIAVLRQQIISREEQLKDRNQQLINKDKQILEIGNLNSVLHIRISCVMKQIESLNKLMSKKDQEICNKKEQIQQYCRTLERLTAKQKQEENTNFTESYHMTPRIEEKGQEEQDEFYSFENFSLRDNSWMERRYMTPNSQKGETSLYSAHSSERQPNEDCNGDVNHKQKFALNIPNWNAVAHVAKKEADSNFYWTAFPTKR